MLLIHHHCNRLKRVRFKAIMRPDAGLPEIAINEAPDPRVAARPN
jgi:hypothetical protein